MKGDIMKNKPDDYYNNGIVEMARFGRNIIMKNNMSKEQHKQQMDYLKSNYPNKKKEIDSLILSIRERVSKCNPIQLLSFASDVVLMSAMGISSEIEVSPEVNRISRITEYIQSIFVSTENHYVECDEDPSAEFFAIQADVEKLYDLINEFYFYWGACLKDWYPEYNDDTIKEIVEAQMLYLVRGNRYQIHEIEYYEKLLNVHDNELRFVYGLSAIEILDGIKKIQYALSQGKFDYYNKLMTIFDSFENCENPFENETVKEVGKGFVENVFGTKLRDVIEVTGWNEKFVSSLSYEINEEKGFFDNSEFAGWPIRDLPVQKKPFIKIEDRYYCFDYYSFVDNFYRVLQKSLKKVDPAYNWGDKQKEASEKMVSEIFTQILPGCTVYTDNYYPQNGSMKKMAENDIVVLFNDAMLIVEVKAGSFVYTPPFIDFGNHILSYKSLIEKADHQCQRTYDYLMSKANPEIYRADKSYKASIKMDKIKEVYMMTVTVDNINSFAAHAEKLNFLQLKCNAISISIDDLMVYRDFFESPLIFLHFLKQRRQATQVANLVPNDELDHLGMYIKHNCYCLQFIDISNDTTLRIYGYREELDKYFSQLYHPQLCPSKPSLHLPNLYNTILEYLTTSSLDNKCEIATYLLDFSEDAKKQFCEQIKRAFNRQREIMNYSIINASGSGDSLRYTCFVHQPDLKQISEQNRKDYVMSTLVWNEEIDRVMLEFYFDNKGNIQWMNFERFISSNIIDSEREQLFELGKIRAQRLLLEYQSFTKRKIGRNELCPCGSGKKYKNCCLKKLMQ